MKFTFLTCFFFFCINLSGQTDNIWFKYLTPNEGLSSSCVNCITQDDLGYIWIGTNDGLNKFDGYTFEVFKSSIKDTNSLWSNYILSLYFDEKGVLWIGTSRGINVYDRSTNSFVRRHDLPKSNIFEITNAPKGDIFIGSENLYLLKKESNELIEYYPSAANRQSISNGNVTALHVGGKEGTWVCTQYGLNLFNQANGTFKHFFANKDTPNTIDDNNVRSITKDKNGILWVGTEKGLNEVHFMGNNADSVLIRSYGDKIDKKNTTSIGAVTALHCDPFNNLWIGTRNGGLGILKLDGKYAPPYNFMTYKYSEHDRKGLNCNSINCIYQDTHENIWIGTFSGGLNLYCKDTKNFQLVKHQPLIPQSINSNQANTFLEDEKYIWIGTEGGLNRFDKETETFKHYTHDPQKPNSIGANAVWALAKGNNGKLWVGTWRGGLNLLDIDAGTFVRYQTQPLDSCSINCNNVFSICPDEKNSLWIGTMGGGLNHFDPEKGQFTHYTIKNSKITTDFVEDIIETHSGQLLLANVNGVSVFDKQKRTFKPMVLPGTKPVELTSLNIFDLYVDKKRNLWIGTESGLFVIDSLEKIVQHYTEIDGLPNNSIKSILEDGKGNLWLGTNRGICKFNRAIGLPSSPSFNNYTLQDGLQGNEFSRRSSLLSKAGLMYFGGNNGYNIFHPDSIKTDTKRNNVIITDFLLFNKVVEIGTKGSPLQRAVTETSELILNSAQTSFGFRFVSINFLSPKKQKYAYLLKGFDVNWNYVGTQREANYTNINPGNYDFLVKVDNGDGTWNEPPTRIKITILPPFWRTIWAYFIYGALFILVLFFYRRYTIIKINTKNQLEIEHLKYAKQEEINQAKLHFFTNLSHEIRTPLTLINEPVEDLLENKKTPKKIKQQLGLAHQNIKRLLVLVNQLLDFRKVDEGVEDLRVSYNNITELINHIIHAFKYQKGIKKLKFNFKNSEEQVYMWFDYEKMTTILYNLISNAVKYNPGFGRIDIEVSKIEKTLRNNSQKTRYPLFKKSISIDTLEIRIKDQGIGIPENQLDKIFDRYYQVSNRHADGKIKGNGIGLNISRQYVELHQGKIWAESSVGAGSCFVIHIPMKREHLNPTQIVTENKASCLDQVNELVNQERPTPKPPTNPELETDAIKGLGKETILFIDDNIELLNFLESRLLPEYSIIKAQTGRLGLELAMKYLPDIIISDVMMPEMDGVTLTEKLKTDINTSHIPIILLTAKVQEENIIEGVGKGADAYILKPFKIKLLKAYIMTILDSRRNLKEKYAEQIRLEPKNMTINPVEGDFVRNLMKVVERNISNPEFGVQDLSEEMHMSYRVLVRKTKAMTDQSINEFIRTIRLKKAAKLLAEDKLPIAKVSEIAGFSDPAYFSRCFSNQFGLSPKQYKNKEVINAEFNKSK